KPVVPTTKKLRGEPGTSGPPAPATRVSTIRQGGTGVKERSLSGSPIRLPIGSSAETSVVAASINTARQTAASPISTRAELALQRNLWTFALIRSLPSRGSAPVATNPGTFVGLPANRNSVWADETYPIRCE